MVRCRNKEELKTPGLGGRRNTAERPEDGHAPSDHIRFGWVSNQGNEISSRNRYSLCTLRRFVSRPLGHPSTDWETDNLLSMLTNPMNIIQGLPRSTVTRERRVQK